jgi:hypothetical protein
VFLGRSVAVVCAHRPTTRAGHLPWDRAAHRPVPVTIPEATEKTPPGLWPGLDARLADAGQLSGAMLAPSA